MTALPCKLTGAPVQDILASAVDPGPRETMAAGGRSKGECLTASCSDGQRSAQAVSGRGIAHG
jgi:hypothetical protein